MYGDCQVMSGMGGGNGIPSESLFSSSIHQNHSFNFMSTLPFTEFSSIIPKEESTGMVRTGKEEMTSGSGSDQIEGGLSGNDQEADQQQKPPAKRKRYHRHTARQIQEMEALFKECPHPDDKQRMRLSQELGLKPRQVKFWFQNRRTQMKAQQDRADNAMLRADNENLRNENYRLQNALRGIICTNCGGPGMSIEEQEIRMENIRLKRELEHYNSLLGSPYCGRSIQVPGQGPPPPSSLLPSNLDLDMNIYPRAYDQEVMPNCIDMIQLNPLMAPEDTHFHATNGLIIMEEEKSLALELAASYMEEVVKMCRVREPLWVPVNDTRKEVLSEKEYNKMFPWPITRKNDQDGLRCEATRDSMLVIMNSITLVDAFLDADKWIELFPSIISRAKTLQVISSGHNGHLNGSLQLMNAELQMLSPLVPTREIYFLRYCEQIVDEGSWVIVDFPLDSFHETYQPSLPRYRRCPSGCIIQDMPNGYSRVTWVEHAEVEDEPLHRIFHEFVSSGMAFGANRWLAVLQRQCERLASLMARNISDLGVIPSPEARKNMMNLAQRMIRMFSVNISASFGQSWTALSADSVDDTVRITTRKVTVPGQPNGLMLSAVSTTWLPYPHYRVFNLLRDRCQLDVLSNGNPLQEVAHIANGSHHGNCTSLLRVNVASNSSQNVELILQESCTDESSSIVAYSTVDVDAIKLAMNGEDPSCIPLLPLGFVIVPWGNECDNGNSNESGGGCLLTIGLQDIASIDPTAKLNLSSVTAINNRICNTLHQITAALAAGGNGNSGNHGIENGGGSLHGSSLDPPETAVPKKESPTP